MIETVCLKLTSLCNYSCQHCWRKYTNDKLSVNSIVNFAAKSAKQGLRHISLSGGEPTLFPDLPLLIKELTNFDLFISITSNGTNKKVILDLANTFSDEKLSIRLSIDGPEEINDHLRSIGAYEKTIELAKELQAAHHLVNFNIVAMEYNKNAIISLTEALLTLGANHIGIIKGYGDVYPYGLKSSSWDKIENSKNRNRSLSYWNYDIIPNKYCVIESDGSVTFPGESTFCVGNIVENMDFDLALCDLKNNDDLLKWNTKSSFR
jgi:MoaA/NifB/PqqE/SkfB family radical SAM enzyme